MRYQEFLPHRALRLYVERFWVVSSRGEPAPSQAGRIFPDGCIELVLNFSDALHLTYPNGEIERQPVCAVVGQLERAVGVWHAGRAEYLGVRFHPVGANSLFKTPLSELTGRILPLDAVFAALDRELAQGIDLCWATEKKVAAVESVLLERCGKADSPDPLMSAAVRILQESCGNVFISSLSKTLSVNQRTLERKFSQMIGVSPKLFGRVQRFQAVCRAAEQNKKRSWSDYAAVFGYHDQAHLIKDFQEFSGETPGRLFHAGLDCEDRIRRM